MKWRLRFFVFRLITRDQLCSCLPSLSRRPGGSSFALARPVYETLLRGTWFSVCGTDDLARQFQDTDEFPGGKLQNTVKAIEAALDRGGYPEATKIFSKVQNGKLITTMHSLTHGGWKIVGPYLSGEGVGCSFNEGEVCEVIHYAKVMASYVVAYMIDLLSRYDKEAAIAINTRFDEIDEG